MAGTSRTADRDQNFRQRRARWQRRRGMEVRRPPDGGCAVVAAGLGPRTLRIERFQPAMNRCCSTTSSVPAWTSDRSGCRCWCSMRVRHGAAPSFAAPWKTIRVLSSSTGAAGAGDRRGNGKRPPRRARARCCFGRDRGRPRRADGERSGSDRAIRSRARRHRVLLPERAPSGSAARLFAGEWSERLTPSRKTSGRYGRLNCSLRRVHQVLECIRGR